VVHRCTKKTDEGDCYQAAAPICAYQKIYIEFLFDNQRIVYLLFFRRIKSPPLSIAFAKRIENLAGNKNKKTEN
jgi:hypothetical protein